jgi:hypothetical protein
MQIIITIPDEQWQEFQQLAQEAVEMKWNGSYEDFATYIMTANFENYLESQKRKQEKKMKNALASYEASLKQEQDVPVIKAPVTTIAIAVADPTPKEPKPAKKPAQDKTGDEVMTNKELSERIAQLEEVPFKQRTMAEAQELNDLLILRKKRMKAKVKKK